MRRSGLFDTAVLCLALTAPVLGVSPALAKPSSARAVSADKRFEAIADDEYAWRLKSSGPSEDGPKSEELRLPDVGPAIQAARLARWTMVAQQLADLPVAKLSKQNQVNYAVYKGQIDALLAEQRYREYEKPLNADSSFWGDVAEWARGSFRTEADYRGYIAMMREMPRYYDQQILNMRAGLKRGFTPAQVTLQGRDAGVALVAEVAHSEDSPFYAPFKTMRRAAWGSFSAPARG